ncbi:cytidylyltransferase domain-containing protein [Azospirillum halopraeferens]|uniref:acylneuraminate cytidylyltransferase family protein n=1 Tax=Azospirillum halopraeferens TaxID=34010 RepID=UPI00041E565E|nr:acylneuraminate cytidylyltransferase family protein [Azospirillum halopraeferens]
MKRLCTICARGGSKGVPGKNIRPLAGRPLLAHSLVQARESGLFDRIAVSSDDPAILEVAREWGADQLIERPADMATDTAGKLPAIRHAVLAAEAAAGGPFDTLVDLDATSPLRLPEDIRGAVALLEGGDADCVITAAPARRSPYFNLVEIDGAGIVRLSKPLPGEVLRRQDAPACFDMNASIYVWRRDPFVDRPAIFGETTRLFVMPPERSVDIDEPLDFDIVELLMRRRAEHRT